LDVKTKTATGVEFNSGGSSNTDSGKVTGSLETKYKCADYGMTFTEKWSTDNSLATTIELADKPLKGAKLVFDSTFSPQTGKFIFYEILYSYHKLVNVLVLLCLFFMKYCSHENFNDSSNNFKASKINKYF
jgi:hypothetical protein